MNRFASLLVVALTAAACGPQTPVRSFAVTEDVDAGVVLEDPVDAGEEEPAVVDAGSEVEEVDAGVDDGTPAAGACLTPQGGVLGNGACGSDAQCCDGVLTPGLGVCGGCVCVATDDAEGCANDNVAFVGTENPLPDDVVDGMTGVSWRPDCPIELEELALLEMTHVGFDGLAHAGRLVVRESVAADVLLAFEALYAADYPIERMRLVDEYDADDLASMADNNTSAFNCRFVAGTDVFSQHTFGRAIDINPLINPFVKNNGSVSPPEGEEFADRTLEHPAMIREGDVVTETFDALGWGWGGRFGNGRDYQHFSENGQ